LGDLRNALNPVLTALVAISFCFSTRAVSSLRTLRTGEGQLSRACTHPTAAQHWTRPGASDTR
jgi:hypothetical protein